MVWRSPYAYPCWMYRPSFPPTCAPCRAARLAMPCEEGRGLGFAEEEGGRRRGERVSRGVGSRAGSRRRRRASVPSRSGPGARRRRRGGERRTRRAGEGEDAPSRGRRRRLSCRHFSRPPSRASDSLGERAGAPLGVTRAPRRDSAPSFCSQFVVASLANFLLARGFRLLIGGNRRAARGTATPRGRDVHAVAPSSRRTGSFTSVTHAKTRARTVTRTLDRTRSTLVHQNRRRSLVARARPRRRSKRRSPRSAPRHRAPWRLKSSAS